MAILFAILKTILKILLIILALIILIILLVLFVPFRYRAAGVKEPGLVEAEASVTWLLHMLTVEIGYSLTSGKGFTKDIRIFGISLFKVKSWLDERKKSKAEKEKEKKKREKKAKLERLKTEDPERYEQLRREAKARKLEEKKRQEEEERRHREEEERKKREEAERLEAERKRREEELARQEAEKQREEERIRREAAAAETVDTAGSPEITPSENDPEIPDKKQNRSSGIKGAVRSIFEKAVSAVLKLLAKLLRFLFSVSERIWHIPGTIVSKSARLFEKIDSFLSKIGNLCTKAGDIFDFLNDEHTREVLSLLKKQIGKLLGHILPKKLTGYLEFGLDDPYLTGRVLATACVFYPLYGRTFRLEPDFEQLVFNGRAELKGRIFVFYLIYIALATYFNKNTKFVINYLKSFRSKEDSE